MLLVVTGFYDTSNPKCSGELSKSIRSEVIIPQETVECWESAASCSHLYPHPQGQNHEAEMTGERFTCSGSADTVSGLTLCKVS